MTEANATNAGFDPSANTYDETEPNGEHDSDGERLADIIGHISMFKLTGVVLAQNGTSLVVSSNFDTWNTVTFSNGTLKQPVTGCRIVVSGEIYSDTLLASRMAIFEPDGGMVSIKVE